MTFFNTPLLVYYIFLFWGHVMLMLLWAAVSFKFVLIHMHMYA